MLAEVRDLLQHSIFVDDEVAGTQICHEGASVLLVDGDQNVNCVHLNADRILHLSILWVPVSLFLLAGTLFAGWPSNAWSHAAGTGAVACLILGVIARVALGHSGRPLVLPKGMVLAFVAIHLAALIRVLTAFEIIPWHPGIGSSTLLWLFAFGMFLCRYTGILASPRPDGREG